MLKVMAKAKRVRASATPKPAKVAKPTASKAKRVRASATPKPAKVAKPTASKAKRTRASAKPKPAKVATPAASKAGKASQAASKAKPRGRRDAARRKPVRVGRAAATAAVVAASPQAARRSLRARLLEDGEALCCCFLMSGSPVVAEIASRIFPVVLIDCEHGSAGMGLDLIHMLQAVRSGGAEALVRVPEFSASNVTRVLDAGADGVVVPLVESAEQAQAALAAARYPPSGRRGVAPSCVRASGWGVETSYATRADSDALVLVQVETMKAAEKGTLEGILNSGADGVFLGPADMSASAGHLGDVDHPKVFALRERVEKACAQKGVFLAGFAAGRVSARDMIQKRGYKLVASSVDVVLLRDAALNNLKASRGDGGGSSQRRSSAGY